MISMPLTTEFIGPFSLELARKARAAFDLEDIEDYIHFCDIFKQDFSVRRSCRLGFTLNVEDSRFYDGDLSL